MNRKWLVRMMVVGSAFAWSIVVLSSSAFAEQVLIFGPMTYAKDFGKPVTYKDSFTVPTGVDNIKLFVKNGSGDAGEVKNVSISLNGVEVVTSADLRHTTSTEKTINYRRNTTNTISVTIKGEGGTAVVVEMYGDKLVVTPPQPPTPTPPMPTPPMPTPPMPTPPMPTPPMPSAP